jgi:ABC-type branched-subunit amino acid transport system ATPase component
MLELRSVSKLFSGIPAVDDITFSARPGEVTGHLGPNGSGKSTTMKMITGLIEMTSGHILFEGKAYRQLGMAAHSASPVGEVCRCNPKIAVAAGCGSGLVHLGIAVTVVQAVARGCGSPRSSCRCWMDLC